MCVDKSIERSQSPQTGQFNSYGSKSYCCEVYGRVSIPSNGSIQFLPAKSADIKSAAELVSQSPQTGQFNSYRYTDSSNIRMENLSQSPQTGQFNSYGMLLEINWMNWLSLNPLKRVNSILTVIMKTKKVQTRIVSIPSNGSIQFLRN